jgi:hypothetical protein
MRDLLLSDSTTRLAELRCTEEYLDQVSPSFQSGQREPRDSERP